MWWTAFQKGGGGDGLGGWWIGLFIHVVHVYSSVGFSVDGAFDVVFALFCSIVGMNRRLHLVHVAV